MHCSVDVILFCYSLSLFRFFICKKLEALHALHELLSLKSHRLGYSFFARFKSTDLCIILVSGTWQIRVCLFELNWIPDK